MATFNQIPETVEFSQPYSDGSGERIKVSYSKSKADLQIETIDFILVNKDDLEWLIDVLQDCKRLYNESKPKQ